MRLSIILFVTVFFSTVSASAQKWDQSPFKTQSFGSQSVSRVESSTSGGNIVVTGGASETKVEVFVQAANRKLGQDLSAAALEERIRQDYELEVSLSSGVLVAKAKAKTRNMDWKRSLSISFKIYVPSNVNSKLLTSGGNIVLSNLKGTQDFTTSGGNLELSSLRGSVKGVTSGGNIVISNSNDEINLSTSGGNVVAENCNGNIDLTTSGGNVEVRGMGGKVTASTSGGNVMAESITADLGASTSGGNIRLKGLSGSVEASTSGGKMEVDIAKLGKYIKLTNSAGNIEVSLPKDRGMDLDVRADRVKVEVLNNFNGKTERDLIDGRINGGGVPVTIRGGSGRVSLKFN